MRLFWSKKAKFGPFEGQTSDDSQIKPIFWLNLVQNRGQIWKRVYGEGVIHQTLIFGNRKAQNGIIRMIHIVCDSSLWLIKCV